MTDAPSPKHDVFQQVVGEQLSGVTFVMHYLQLQFNPPPIINVYTPVTVFSRGESVRSGDDQFRNRLCEQIAKIVKSVGVVPGDALKITFEDASVIAASLQESDYAGPEAVEIQGRDKKWDVI
jgi:hypothetical protein